MKFYTYVYHTLWMLMELLSDISSCLQIQTLITSRCMPIHWSKLRKQEVEFQNWPFMSWNISRLSHGWGTLSPQLNPRPICCFTNPQDLHSLTLCDWTEPSLWLINYKSTVTLSYKAPAIYTITISRGHHKLRSTG